MECIVNKVVVITGAGRGIGKALTHHCLSQGCRVIGCSRSPVEMDSEGYRHVCLDVADEGKVKEMFADIRRNEGRVDILINNAGVTSMNHAVLTPSRTVRDIFDTNVLGAFLCSREAVKLMQKHRFGRIVNMSTVAVALAPAGTSIYGASKAALEQFSRVLAREVASYGITVNALSLAPVKDSGMVEVISDEGLAETIDRTIARRWITFEDIAHAVDFLVSPKSDTITGQTICVGGV